MPTLEIVVMVKEDGRPLPGYPLVRRMTASEVKQAVLQHPSAGVLVVETAPLSSLTGLLIRPDQNVSVRLNGQSTNEWTLNAGGLLLILDAAIETADHLALENASGVTANITLLVAGQ